MELSRGSSGDNAGNDGLPFTPVEIKTMNIGGTDHYALKFNGHIRTILSSPLQYEDNGLLVTLPDGAYTICHLDEVVGDLIGNESFDYQFQLVVGELCTSSYTDRDGVADGKGDGATDEENIRVGGTLFRIFDMSSCNARTSGSCKVSIFCGAYDLPSIAIILQSFSHSIPLLLLFRKIENHRRKSRSFLSRRL